ncbi:Fe2+-dependent dioxygenase [Parasphingopyxis algicola]|uniref:Fe2+-dependent dioxygenase n=1 Tax=Parasphingopyxis algicola TaxID=2026624 RepID=UPI0015A4D67B|nr:Fe2+-dependent dioxygenase [Parasphingopyxis algicola]QLC23792.1 Fe2+-dependent dioxygenase [Parasphingopyxis algicola]
MFKMIYGLLNGQDIKELREIIETATFVDGKISNPHSLVKDNLHLNDEKAYERSSTIMTNALLRNEEFRSFAFPRKIAPPLITRYQKGMRYGLHPDMAFMQSVDGPVRSDISCTIFLQDPSQYEGGALHIKQSDGHMRFKGELGSAIIYPSTTLHEVEEITKGERIVGITFIESQIADPFKRELLYELNDVAALEGANMSAESFTRIQTVQQNLFRRWGEC